MLDGALRLVPLPALDFDVDVDERDGRGRDAGDAAGLAESAWANAVEFLVHLAREAADRLVVEPVRDDFLFRSLQPLDRLFLLAEVAGVLDLGFDRLELVADVGGEMIFGSYCTVAIKELRYYASERWYQVFDDDLGTLEQLSEG